MPVGAVGQPIPDALHYRAADVQVVEREPQLKAAADELVVADRDGAPAQFDEGVFVPRYGGPPAHHTRCNWRSNATSMRETTSGASASEAPISMPSVFKRGSSLGGWLMLRRHRVRLRSIKPSVMGVVVVVHGDQPPAVPQGTPRWWRSRAIICPLLPTVHVTDCPSCCDAPSAGRPVTPTPYTPPPPPPRTTAPSSPRNSNSARTTSRPTAWRTASAYARNCTRYRSTFASRSASVRQPSVL